jgi:hypothetical protein
MHEEDGRPRFNPYRFAIAVTFLVFSAFSYIAPAYAGVEDSWRWIIYAVGIFFFLFGCVGSAIEVGSVYGGTENFRLAVYVIVLFAVAAVLHLTTVYIPMPNGLIVALRLIVYALGLPWLILAWLGAVRLIEALPAHTNWTHAILTILAFLGALLPILVSVLGSP